MKKCEKKIEIFWKKNRKKNRKKIEKNRKNRKKNRKNPKKTRKKSGKNREKNESKTILALGSCFCAALKCPSVRSFVRPSVPNEISAPVAAIDKP